MNWKLIAVALVVVVSGTGYYIWNRKSASDVVLPDQVEKEIVRTRSGIFHPDSVVGFRWTIDDNNFIFERKNRNHPWKPGVVAGIQERLLLLSLLDITELEEKGEPVIEVEISFPNDMQWRGAWDGQRFYWLNGAFEGYGAKLTEEQQQLFEAGQYAFEGRQFDWCRHRVTRIENQTAPQMLLQKDGLAWFKGESKESEVDSTRVEQWFGRNCKIKVDQYIDLKLVRLPTEEQFSFSVMFRGGDELKWQRIGANKFKAQTRGFVSKDFVQELNFLSEL